MSDFVIGELTVERGTRSFTRLRVAPLADGTELALPLHVVHGAHAGPSMLVVGVVHGEEIFAIDAIRDALRQIDATKLRGTVMAVPVANPIAFAAQERNTPTDRLDLNRQFPGDADGWLSERIAASLTELLERSDVLIHIDGGTPERVIHYTFIKQGGGASDSESERLSRAFGMKMLYRGAQSKGSITSYAAAKGIPTVLAMIGGALLYSQPRYLELASRGVVNVLRALGMMDGAPPEPVDQCLVTRRELIRVPMGGVFHPSVGLESLDGEVAGGTVLGTILDPFSLEEVASIQAPYRRTGLLQMRVLPTSVEPGDYAYIAADLESETAA